MKMLANPAAPQPVRFVGEMLQGAAKPVGSDGEGTIQLADPHRPDRRLLRRHRRRPRIRHPRTAARRAWLDLNTWRHQEAPRSQPPQTPSCRGLATALLAYHAFFSISRYCWPAGKHTSAGLAELFGVARSTVYRAIKRAEATGTAATQDKAPAT